MQYKEADRDRDRDVPSPLPEKVLYDNRIKRKNVLALNEKVAALREYEKLPIYKRIGRMFHCSPDQIKRIVQSKDSILKAWEQRTRRSHAKTREMKVVRTSMLGKAVYDWIRRMMYYKDIMITDGLIQKMALQFKSAMGLQNFFPHQDWCDKFREVYNIRTNDSKLLSIGYTECLSVQIKDVVKDVLSECPEEDALMDSCDEIEDDQVKDENDNDEKVVNEQEPTVQIPKNSGIVLPKMRTFNGKFMTLPIHTNGTDMPRKVLVATPINPAGKTGAATPMTMTIIPLTTIAQPPGSNNGTASATTLTNEKPALPTPIAHIKQEIKEEPVSDDYEEVQVKQEYLSDEEEEVEQLGTFNGPLSETSPNNNSQPPRLRVATETQVPVPRNQDVAPQESNSKSVQSNVEKVMQDNSTPKPGERQAQPTLLLTRLGPDNMLAKFRPQNLPPPPLMRAPTAANASVPGRTASKRKLVPDDASALPAIKSCGEARKYLKLLEDFALVKENFRLIGLITRADEVLRELDGDDDVDID